MSKLEDLVPPLELCKQIPDGAFADSALVWLTDLCGEHPIAEPRRYAPDQFIECPAPTLAEIMEALPKHVEYRWYEGKFCPCHPKHDPVEFADNNPASSALKLRLALTTFRRALARRGDRPQKQDK